MLRIRSSRAGAIALLGLLWACAANAMPTTIVGALVVIRVNDDVTEPGADVAAGSVRGSTWNNAEANAAYRFLQDALTRAGNERSAGNTVEVWVAGGTYRPDESASNPSGSGSRSATFGIGIGVSAYGGFAGTEATRSERILPIPTGPTTILSGDLNADDGPAAFEDYGENSLHVVTFVGAVTDADVLDGFTIRAGNADGAGTDANRGGGMLVEAGSPKVRGCRFERNRASFAGGAARSGATRFENCVFVENRAMSQGGALFNDGAANPLITNCEFDANTSLDAEGWGGAIMNFNSSPVITGSLFRNNHAQFGGAIFSFDGSGLYLRTTRFHDNFAEGGFGGALALNRPNAADMIDCGFFANMAASNGGAINIAAGPGTVTIVGSKFGSNAAVGDGGAIQLINGAAVLLVNCLINGNTGSVHGGGVNMREGAPCSLAMDNCTVVRNASANGGGVHNDRGTVRIRNSILRLNTGWQYHHSNDGLLNELLYCNIQGLAAWQQGGVCNSMTCAGCEAFCGLGPLTIGPGNIDAVPLFMDQNGANGLFADEDDDYRLQSASPGIDAGDNAAVGPDILDLDGDTNTTEPVPLDLVRRPRFYDNPLVADNGAGTSPIVDMGAYESIIPPTPTILYVSATAPPGGDGLSWATAKRYLQDGLALADIFIALEGGAQLWVAAGTYRPDETAAAPSGSGDRNATFLLRSGLSIVGGFRGLPGDEGINNNTARPLGSATGRPTLASTLSGDLSGNDVPGGVNRADNSRHVITADGVGASAALDGFSIQAGFADPSAFPIDQGAALVITDSSATVNGCSFSDSVARRGGAIHASGTTDMRFHNCWFDRNRSTPGDGGAILIENGATLRLRDCLLTRNTSGDDGGAIQTRGGGSRVYITRTYFVGNIASRNGGALELNTNAATDAVSCLFLGNRGFDGSAFAIKTASRGTFSNCIAAENVGGAGAGFALGQAQLELFNCTILQNVGQTQAGGIHANEVGTLVRISNSLLVSNVGAGGEGGEAGQLTVIGGAQSILSYNIITRWTGGLGGPGNANGAVSIVTPPSIGSDTIWGTADDGYGNFGQQLGSAGIDSGDPSLLPADVNNVDDDDPKDTLESLPLDFAGNARIEDDPNTEPNPGPAPESPLDIGAHEFIADCPTCPGPRRWRLPVDGFYGDVTKWTPSRPTPVHEVIFDHPSEAIAVRFDDDSNSLPSPIRARRLIVRNGTLNFDLRRSPPPPSSPISYLRYALSDTQLPSIEIADRAGSMAHLIIRDGTLEGVTARIASEVGAVGEITVTGPNSRFDVPGITGDLEIGGDGVGRMNMLGGADGLAAFSTIGNQPTAAGSRLTVAGAGSEWTSVFTMQVANGTLEVRDGGRVTTGFGTFVTAAGRIIGDGTIIGPVVNFGSVEPGNSPGTLTINGNYTQAGVQPGLGTSSGSLRVELAIDDAGAITAADKLMISGSARLGGGLIVTTIGSAIPNPNGIIEIVRAGSLDPANRRFDVAYFPAVAVGGDGRGRFMRVDYDETSARGVSAISLRADLLLAEIGLFPDGTTVPGEPSAVAAGDLDGDGDDDLVIAIPGAVGTAGTVYILWSDFDLNGDYAPTPVNQAITVGVDPAAIAIGDFGGSAVGLDIAVANAGTDATNNSITIIMDPTPLGGAIETILNGNGGALIDEPRGLAAGDFDNSRGGAAAIVGDDLAIVNAGRGLSNGNVQLLLRDDGARFVFRVPPVAPVGRRPRGVAPVNPTPPKESNLDLAVANFGDGTVSLLQNNGTGGLSPIGLLNAGAGVFAVAAGNLNTDPDGRPELVAINGLDGTVSVFVNSPQPPRPACRTRTSPR